MIGICKSCRSTHGVQSSTTHPERIMILHTFNNVSCDGSGYPPVAYSIRATKSSILPEWVSDTICSVAYDQGHSSGFEEIAMIEESLIYDFEEALKKARLETLKAS